MLYVFPRFGFLHAVCFIQCLPPVDPYQLIKRVLTDMETTGASRSRFVQRLSPVRVLCRTDTESIRTAAMAALAPAFPEGHARTVCHRVSLHELIVNTRANRAD